MKAVKKVFKNEYYDWLLKKGQSFTPSKNHEKLLKQCPKRWRRIKQCYSNSQMFTIELQRKGIKAKYYEGFYTTKVMPGLPIEHGWIVIEGDVLELTCSDVIEYYGMEIPIKKVLKHQIKTSMAESMLIKIWRDENEN